MPLSRARERLLRRISTRKGREAERVVPIEGPRAIGAALDHGASVLFALVEEGDPAPHAALVERLAGAGAEVVVLPPELLGTFMETEATQGILAVAREPDLPLSAAGPDAGGVLLLDGVQEPGNVGALVRVAAAFGLARVIALDGSADPWSGKAVRGSAGLVFALPVHAVPWAEARRWLERSGIPLLAADGGGEDVREWLRREGPGGGWALALGNEGRGLRPELVAASAARIRVPIAPGVESLNVATAGAVLAWALGPGRGGRSGEEAADGRAGGDAERTGRAGGATPARAQRARP